MQCGWKKLWQVNRTGLLFVEGINKIYLITILHYLILDLLWGMSYLMKNVRLFCNVASSYIIIIKYYTFRLVMTHKSIKKSWFFSLRTHPRVRKQFLLISKLPKNTVLNKPLKLLINTQIQKLWEYFDLLFFDNLLQMD